MALIQPFSDIKLFVGILFSTKQHLQEILDALVQDFGEIDFQSSYFSFDHTTFYQQEMGSELNKCFVSFAKLWSPDTIYDAKCKTQVLEQRWMKEGNRRVNLDPGYVALHQVVLLTTKNYAHRIPLQQGIYAELTYIWRQGKFDALPWTYPDFQFGYYMDTLKTIRYLLLKTPEHV